MNAKSCVEFVLQAMNNVDDEYLNVKIAVDYVRHKEIKRRERVYAYVWGDRIFEKCGIGRDEGGDGGKTLEIRGKRRLSARDGGANYQQS